MQTVSNIKAKLTFFALCFSLVFTSCTKQNSDKTSSSKSNTTVITATFYPLYIMLMNITDGAQNISLNLLAPANTGCLHDYQLTTKDMQAISKSSIVVANGAGMEDFIEKVLEAKKDSTIIATDGYQLIKAGEEENPHVWVSIAGSIHMVEKITQNLCILNPENASLYTTNAENYIHDLKQLKQTFDNELNVYQGRNIITFHEAFPYFASELKLNTSLVIEREPGTAPSPKELEQLIKLIKNTDKGTKPVLFAEPQYSSASAQVISDETGYTVFELDPCVTGELTKDAYIKAMYNNIEVLKQAFSNRE